MANSDKPRGAVPKGIPLRQNRYVAGGTVYPGDFVAFDNAGKVVAGTDTGAALGVAANYATTGQNLDVYDHPDQLFVIQSDDATEPAAQTACNLNYEIEATTGDTLFKTSRMEFDGSTGATNSNLPIKLLSVEGVPGNDFGGYADCIVKINNHQLTGGTGTLGV